MVSGGWCVVGDRWYVVMSGGWCVVVDLERLVQLVGLSVELILNVRVGLTKSGDGGRGVNDV